MYRPAKIISLILLFIACCSCQLFHRPDIKQGNELTPSSAQAIRQGMSKEQVIAQLGSPVLKNIYQNNTLIYVYTLKPGWHKQQQQQLIVHFNGNRVTSITTSDRGVTPLATQSQARLPQPTHS